MLLCLGDTLAAAGRTAEALDAYRKVLADTTAHKAHHEAARKAMGQTPHR
mgnify:FL=1